MTLRDHPLPSQGPQAALAWLVAAALLLAACDREDHREPGQSFLRSGGDTSQTQ